MSWLDNKGSQCFAITLCCKEAFGNIEVIHGLPIILTKETDIDIDGEQSELISLRNYASQIYDSFVNCKYKIESGWLYADQISFNFSDDTPSDDIAIINYFQYDDYLKVPENKQPFLVLTEGNESKIQGHLVSITEIPNSPTYCTIQFYDKLGSAPIVHSINVECDGYVPTYPENTSTLSEFNVAMKSNRLFLSQ